MIFISELGSLSTRISNLERKKKKNKSSTPDKGDYLLSVHLRTGGLGLRCLPILIPWQRLQTLPISWLSHNPPSLAEVCPQTSRWRIIVRVILNLIDSLPSLQPFRQATRRSGLVRVCLMVVAYAGMESL